MVLQGSQPVAKKTVASGNANANHMKSGQERQMVPLNADKTIPKKN